jgi:hypothetical protein
LRPEQSCAAEENSIDSAKQRNGETGIIDIDLIQTSVYFVHGPTQSGKSQLVHRTAKALSLTVLTIHPEDYIYNKQIFALATATITGGRTCSNFFEKKTYVSHQFLVLIDELEVTIDTENSHFMSALVSFVNSSCVPLVIASSGILHLLLMSS